MQTVALDTRDVFKRPAQWGKPEWRSAARKAVIVAGAIALLDMPTRDYLQNHRTATTDRIADAFMPFGERYAVGVLAGYALVGKLADKPKAQRIALDGFTSSVITSVLMVPALKALTGRSRPNTDNGSGDFHPFSGEASFPSGHTAFAFTVAASIAESTDRLWLKSLSYGVASLIGYSRMETDAHWLSDVTASAFIGIGVAKEVAKLDRARHGITFAPRLGPDGWGVQVAKSF